jgi:cysteinyl-tRNA synthetase, unknown class
MKPVLFVIFLLMSLTAWVESCPAQTGKSLAAAASWGYQLQNADPDQLAASKYEVLVIDYSRDGTDAGAYQASQIKAIQDRGKFALAYLSIGEAENYRFYWQAGWVPGNPDWLGPKNPEWPDNYKVRYWYSGWWNQVLQPYLDRILNAGFDGVYLDIIDAYWYWHESGGLALTFTADKMVELVEGIAAYTRAAHPGFIICPQNGESIIDDVSTSAMRDRYFQAINAIGVEDLFYHYGTHADQVYRFQMLQLYHQAGKKIFNIEYVGASLWGSYLQSVCAQPVPLIPYAGVPDRGLDELLPDFPRAICDRARSGSLLLLLP